MMIMASYLHRLCLPQVISDPVGLSIDLLVGVRLSLADHKRLAGSPLGVGLEEVDKEQPLLEELLRRA